MRIPVASVRRFAGHGEISVALRVAPRRSCNYYRASNHVGNADWASPYPGPPLFKIFGDLEYLEFEENLPRNRIDIAQKPRVIANDSFRPIC
jgi:hypothetical protein